MILTLGKDRQFWAPTKGLEPAILNVEILTCTISFAAAHRTVRNSSEQTRSQATTSRQVRMGLVLEDP